MTRKGYWVSSSTVTGSRFQCPKTHLLGLDEDRGFGNEVTVSLGTRRGIPGRSISLEETFSFPVECPGLDPSCPLVYCPRNDSEFFVFLTLAPWGRVCVWDPIYYLPRGSISYTPHVIGSDRDRGSVKKEGTWLRSEE